MKTGNLMPKTFGDSVTDLKGGVRMISSFKAEQELLYKQKVSQSTTYVFNLIALTCCTSGRWPNGLILSQLVTY